MSLTYTLALVAQVHCGLYPHNLSGISTIFLRTQTIHSRSQKLPQSRLSFPVPLLGEGRCQLPSGQSEPFRWSGTSEPELFDTFFLFFPRLLPEEGRCQLPSSQSRSASGRLLNLEIGREAIAPALLELASGCVLDSVVAFFDFRQKK